MMWKKFALSLALVTVFLLASVVMPSVSPAATQVVIAQPTETFIFMPVYLARGKGYFKDEGLDVEVIGINQKGC